MKNNLSDLKNRFFILIVFLLLTNSSITAHQIKNFDITILSTMLADRGIGEWGFAALIEADGKKILFDTGARHNTVLNNAKEMGISLADVQDVVLSHRHRDHIGGLIKLRKELIKTEPKALSRVHVGKDFFSENYSHKFRKKFDSLQGSFVEHGTFLEIQPGIWLTGEIPKTHTQINGESLKHINHSVPESMALILNTTKGLIVVTGCGHAGLANILLYAKEKLKKPIYAVLGGFHLFNSPSDQIDWLAEQLKPMNIQYLIGAHCTGIEAVAHLRNALGLSRETVVVGAVGTEFTSSKGLNPLRLAR